MKSISHTINFEIEQPVAELFPLFSPEGEKAWVPGWRYKKITDTTELCEDYIFLTNAHAHNAKDAIWIVKKYEPESYLIQLYRVEPEEKVGVVTVKCVELETAKVKVQVTYKYTALSDKGEAFIDDFTEEFYSKFIGEWRLLLLEYFESNNNETSF